MQTKCGHFCIGFRGLFKQEGKGAPPKKHLKNFRLKHDYFAQSNLDYLCLRPNNPRMFSLVDKYVTQDTSDHTVCDFIRPYHSQVTQTYFDIFKICFHVMT